jgi:hypothetical protein
MDSRRSACWTAGVLLTGRCLSLFPEGLALNIRRGENIWLPTQFEVRLAYLKRLLETTPSLPMTNPPNFASLHRSIIWLRIHWRQDNYRDDNPRRTGAVVRSSNLGFLAMNWDWEGGNLIRV